MSTVFQPDVLMTMFVFINLRCLYRVCSFVRRNEAMPASEPEFGIVVMPKLGSGTNG
jgi:hypothetical protein